jgi:hypothetical protein
MIPLLAANAAAGVAGKAADAVNSLWKSASSKKASQSNALAYPTNFASALAGQGLDLSSVTQAPLAQLTGAAASQHLGSTGKTVNRLA